MYGWFLRHGQRGGPSGREEVKKGDLQSASLWYGLFGRVSDIESPAAATISNRSADAMPAASSNAAGRFDGEGGARSIVVGCRNIY